MSIGKSVRRYVKRCSNRSVAATQASRQGDAAQTTIHEHPEFAAFIAGLEKHFAKWRKATAVSLRKLQPECHPKDVIRELSENLLAHAEGKPLIDPYAVYQHLMDYWAETMQTTAT